MKNYCDLLNQIKEYDLLIKDIFVKRMAALHEIILIEAQNNNKSCIKNIVEADNIKSNASVQNISEYNFYLKNLHSLDKNYKYNKLYKNNTKVETYCLTNQIPTVCYQGLPFSYSESAAKALFSKSVLTPKETFEDVFKDVCFGFSDIGVLPIENSTSGYINEVYDLLLKYDLYINCSYVKKIDHCIAGTGDSKLEDIKEVYSHQQAIAQCREYIDKYGLKSVNESNTAVAAQKIHLLNNKNIACICSREAAMHYGLKILQENINPEQNYTRFVAISKCLILKKTNNRISIVFSIPHETGTLYETLSIFSYYNINLSSIYSRPDLKSPWKYLFYLDFEGNILNGEIKAVFNQLKEELPFLKILGNFKV